MEGPPVEERDHSARPESKAAPEIYRCSEVQLAYIFFPHQRYTQIYKQVLNIRLEKEGMVAGEKVEERT